MTPTFTRTRDLLERSLWTGVEAGLAVLSADSFGWIQASPGYTLLTAGVATLITALKVFAGQRLNALEG